MATAGNATIDHARRGLRPWLLVGVGLAACSGSEPPPAAGAAWPPTVAAAGELHPELRHELELRIGAIERAPEDALAAARFGLLCEANGLWSEARRAFERATELDPDEPAWPFHAALARLPLDDHDGARAWLEEHARRHSGHAPLIALLAEELMLAGSIEAAEARWRQALAVAPDASEVRTGLGEALLALDRVEEATAELRRAVALDAGNKRARYLLGTALARAGRADEAAAELGAGAGARPQRLLDAWSVKARALSYLPADRMARAEELASSGRLDEALDMLERAAELWPDDPRFPCARGIALARLGQHAAAVELLESVGDERRELADAQLEYARSLRALGAHGRAIEAFEVAWAWNPRDAAAAIELGRLLVLEGRFDEAVVVLERLASERSDDWRPQAELCALELERGDLDSAAERLAAARSLGSAPRLERLARRLSDAREPGGRR